LNKKLVRDGFEYYLEIEAEGGEEYEYQMLLVNHIDTILPVNVIRSDEKRQLIYSASGYKTLDSCLEKMLINGEQILGIMECVLKGVDEVRGYLLAPNNLVLSPECIFVEPDYSRAGLIYLPGYGCDIIVQLRELMESLLGRIDSSDMQSVMLAWKLHTLIRDEHISLRELKKIMAGYKEKGTIAPLELKETDDQPEYREVRRTTGGNKKIVIPFSREQISLPFVIGSIVTGILLVCCLFTLGMIYIGGIYPWKRNLLLILAVLLAVSFGITIAFWKKSQIIHILRTLKEK
jgi:hypothetical protein